MSSTNLLNPRKPLVWLLGASVAASLFASGALVARATIDGDDGPESQPQVTTPGIARGESPQVSPNAPAATGANDSAKGGFPGRGGFDTSYAGCRAPLPAGVVTATGIDPAKAGFDPAFPPSGFSATSVRLSLQGECNKGGNAVSGSLVLDSSWLHDATQLEAYISQRAANAKVASVLREDSATFWADGYVFNVGVNGYRILPTASDGVVPPDEPSASPGVTTTGPASPVQPIADPRAKEVLQLLIAQLSPTTDLKCFWTAGPGDWSSLAALGIGDPRPAIPSGFSQQELNVTAFTDPAAGCDTSLKPTEGFSFNAGWQKQDNGFAYLGVSVYNGGGSVDYPGQISEYGANWSRGGLQFGVYAKSEKPLGIEVVRAIARALDPQFNEACFVRERQLSDSDLPGLGFSPAKAPKDYRLVRSSMTASEIAAGCPKPEGFQPNYSLHWSFEKSADVIEAGANRYGSETRGDGSGYQSLNNLNWTSADGTSYYVNGYSKGINPAVSKDDLVAVARSIDPAFDLSKLKEGPGDDDRPVPLPAERK